MSLLSRFTLALLALVCCLLLPRGASGGMAEYEMEYDGAGSLEPPYTPPAGSMSVRVSSSFEADTIGVYWMNEDNGEDVLILQLRPGEEQVMNSFPGHVFHSRIENRVAASDEVSPSYFTIVKSTDFVEIGPADRSSGKPKMQSKRAAAKSGSAIEAGLGSGDAGRTSLHPAIKVIGQRTTAMSAKFKCLMTKVDYYYDDGAEGSFQGTLTLGKETTTNTYEGHVFFFTEHGNKAREVARFTMHKDTFLYVVHDGHSTVPRALTALTNREQAFLDQYYADNGILWRHFFGPDGPRAPPALHMWPATRVGEVHYTSSSHTFWTCNGKAAKCQTPGDLDLQLEVVSLEPKIFIVQDFLSDAEVGEIIAKAKTQLRESTVGNEDGGGARSSDTRTSRNAWVPRGSSAIIETIYKRAADLLQIDDSLMNSNTNAEDMQVVYYKDGQKYDSHHDWGVSGYAESRFITLLFYLTDMEGPDAGGETSFPKAAGGQGIKVHPGKGSAVLFYNLLEDGNGDDLALHAALPIHRGEKWLANFWVWDPKRK